MTIKQIRVTQTIHYYHRIWVQVLRREEVNSEQQQFEHNKNIENSSETQKHKTRHNNTKFQRVGEIKNVKRMKVALEVAKDVADDTSS